MYNIAVKASTTTATVLDSSVLVVVVPGLSCHRRIHSPQPLSLPVPHPSIAEHPSRDFEYERNGWQTRSIRREEHPGEDGIWNGEFLLMESTLPVTVRWWWFVTSSYLMWILSIHFCTFVCSNTLFILLLHKSYTYTFIRMMATTNCTNNSQHGDPIRKHWLVDSPSKWSSKFAKGRRRQRRRRSEEDVCESGRGCTCVCMFVILPVIIWLSSFRIAWITCQIECLQDKLQII